MTSRDFCYWLQGYFEILSASSNRHSEELSQNQTETIRSHLVMVFKHEIDPSFGDKKAQDILSKIHSADAKINC